MNRDLRLVALSLLIWGLGEGTFIYFQPLYLSQLGADPARIGGILGLAALGMMASHLPAGVLADHFGRKTLMTASWVVGMVATYLMAAAPSLPLFTIGLILYNFTVFVMSPMSAYITQARGAWTPARALTTVTAGFSVGLIIGPVLGGRLAEQFGLRFVYFVAAGLFVVSTTLILLIRPQPIEPAHDGHRYRALLGNRRLGRFLGLVFLINLALYFGWPLTPNYLQAVHKIGVGQIGLLGAFTGLGVVILNLSLGRMRAKHGLLIAQTLVGCALAALWLGKTWGFFAAGYFLFAGFRTSRALITATIHGLVNPAELGLAFGANEAVAAAGMTVAAPLAGLAFARSAELPYPVGLSLIAVGLVLSALFAPTAQAEIPPDIPVDRGIPGGD